MWMALLELGWHFVGDIQLQFAMIHRQDRERVTFIDISSVKCEISISMRHADLISWTFIGTARQSRITMHDPPNRGHNTHAQLHTRIVFLFTWPISRQWNRRQYTRSRREMVLGRRCEMSIYVAHACAINSLVSNKRAAPKRVLFFCFLLLLLKR